MAAAARPRSGSPSTRAALNAKLGSNSQALKKATIGLADLNEWAAAYTAEQLVDAYGFTLEEANLFKSAMGEVPERDRGGRRARLALEDLGGLMGTVGVHDHGDRPRPGRVRRAHPAAAQNGHAGQPAGAPGSWWAPAPGRTWPGAGAAAWPRCGWPCWRPAGCPRGRGGAWWWTRAHLEPEPKA